MEKKFTFGAWDLNVKASTYTWQEREGKYYTNEGNKNNDNARKITTTRVKLVGIN